METHLSQTFSDEMRENQDKKTEKVEVKSLNFTHKPTFSRPKTPDFHVTSRDLMEK